MKYNMTLKKALKIKAFFDGRSGARTRDLPRVRRTLSRLSYTPISGMKGGFPAVLFGTTMIIPYFADNVKSKFHFFSGKPYFHFFLRKHLYI